MATEAEDTFPDDLLGFGYKFENGKLQNVKTGEPFQFVVREDDHSYNQRHYEALGEVVTDEIYKLLESECCLRRHKIPIDTGTDPSTFIFMSDDALENPDKLAVFIHGSGVVRAGQWARRLIINESLDSGTQIPFIKEAQKDGYGIIVMNTNDNSRSVNGKRIKIKHSANPEEHAAYVWKKFVKKAKAKHIAVIAHSYGGCVTTSLFQEEKKDFIKRVFAVAFTDSVHYISKPKSFKEFVKIACNWVCSTNPKVGTRLPALPGDVPRVSAGVDVHEKTSWSSFESIFEFLRKRYALVTTGGEEDEDLEANGNGSEGTSAELPKSMSVIEGSAADSQELAKSMSIDENVGALGGEGEKVPQGVHQMSDSEEEKMEEGDGGSGKGK